MKNIHILPTDKARLYIHQGKLYDHKKTMHIADGTQIPQHIYITSDEEIKEGDWVLFSLNDITEIVKVTTIINNAFESKKGFGYGLEYCQKIILTTDVDLIKDGVQVIDDEFLEWFVKNPSYEEVEIADLWKDGTPSVHYSYQLIITKEEPKNETLEEVAKSEAFEFKVDYKPFETDLDYREYAEFGFKKGFKAGAECQAERMYSEEDMRLAIKKARDISDGKDCFDAEDISGCTEICTYDWKFNMEEDSIIEQFKKK